MIVQFMILSYVISIVLICLHMFLFLVFLSLFDFLCMFSLIRLSKVLRISGRWLYNHDSVPCYMYIPNLLGYFLNFLFFFYTIWFRMYVLLDKIVNGIDKVSFFCIFVLLLICWYCKTTHADKKWAIWWLFTVFVNGQYFRCHSLVYSIKK